jgi:2-keto-4-pentenoate hydratase/2-oxohepta-3-ene-1,7-dioic acid hydratase in catechol pathway
MTARELQKSDGQWTRAKGFDTFLPLACLVAPFSPEWNRGMLEVWKNNELVQKDRFSSMVFGFAELVSDLSACMTLEPGDLILTGTPEGVGPVVAGDLLKITISGPAIISLAVTCTA